MLSFKKILVVSPHPDDLEFGCGGAISRLTKEGCVVDQICLSSCRESLRDGMTEDIDINEKLMLQFALALQKIIRSIFL